eukprot:768131-Rhodomonas_salina.2
MCGTEKGCDLRYCDIVSYYAILCGYKTRFCASRFDTQRWGQVYRQADLQVVTVIARSRRRMDEVFLDNRNRKVKGRPRAFSRFPPNGHEVRGPLFAGPEPIRWLGPPSIPRPEPPVSVRPRSGPAVSRKDPDGTEMGADDLFDQREAQAGPLVLARC